MSSAAGRGWGAWLVLDLPVNQIHQESVAGEIKITQQWGGGRNKKEKKGPGLPKYMQHQSKAVTQF